MMKGYVAQQRGRWYAEIYEGLDPVTGRERRTSHPVGTDRDEAERLAARLAIEAGRGRCPDQGRERAPRVKPIPLHDAHLPAPHARMSAAAATQSAALIADTSR
jgi:hypothetical protein